MQKQIEKVILVKKNISNSSLIIANIKQPVINKLNPNMERLELLSNKYNIAYEVINILELSLDNCHIKSNSIIKRFIEDRIN